MEEESERGRKVGRVEVGREGQRDGWKEGGK